MEVFGRFMKSTAQGMKVSRVVPTETQPEDIQDFKLYPLESIDIWRSRKGKTYITLHCKGVHSHYQVLERANAVTKYLKALHQRSAHN